MTREDAIDILTAQTGLSEERVEELARAVCGLKPLSKSALRMRVHRSKRHMVTGASHGDAKGVTPLRTSLKSLDERNGVTHHPSQKKNIRKEEEVEVVSSLPPVKTPPAEEEREETERPVLGENDFCSDDGKIVLTHEDFVRLREEFPLLSNIRGMARHACRSWMKHERRQTHWMYRFRAHLMNRQEAAKHRTAPKPTKTEAADARAEWERQQIEREERGRRAMEFMQAEAERRAKRNGVTH